MKPPPHTPSGVWSPRGSRPALRRRIAAAAIVASILGLLAACSDPGAASDAPGSLKAHLNGQTGFYTGMGFGR